MSLTKRLSLVCSLLFLFTSFTIVTGKKEKTNFEQEFADFKFNLYKYLDNTNSSELMRFELNSNDSVNIVIDKFFDRNIKEIQSYQTHVMESYEMAIDYSDEKYISEDVNFSKFSEYKKEMNSGIYRLMLMEPLNFANTIITVVESQTMNATDIAVESVKDRIAQPSVSSRKIDQNNWEIYIDKYYKVYKLTYNISSNEMALIKILKRVD